MPEPHWQSAAVAGQPTLAIGDIQYAALAAAYAVPARAYHSLSHVGEVLAHYHALHAQVPWRQPREVFLAICYHDAIYVPGRSDNEARSADFAATEISAYLSDAGLDTARVRELILLTARHGRLDPGDVDDEAARFLDCDMAILAADAATFDRYDAGIAEEYRDVVPGFVFRFKRRRFLRSLLDKPRIYLSDLGHARWDAAARANLRRVLG